jgi:hypothetical protein
MRWISIDGGHTADSVCNDLILAEAVLADRGVVAVDDFLNSRAIGVSEGTYQFFLNKNSNCLVPFAYCGNKLFVCRRAAHEFYQSMTLQFLHDNQQLPLSQTYFSWKSKGDNWVNFDLLGHKCLVLS